MSRHLPAVSGRQIRPGTMSDILNQSGITKDQLRELL
jgi:hypothetical protein